MYQKTKRLIPREGFSQQRKRESVQLKADLQSQQQRMWKEYSQKTTGNVVHVAYQNASA